MPAVVASFQMPVHCGCPAVYNIVDGFQLIGTNIMRLHKTCRVFPQYLTQFERLGTVLTILTEHWTALDRIGQIIKIVFELFVADSAGGKIVIAAHRL